MKLIYYKLFLALVLFSACTKSDEITTPDFQVSTVSSTYKKGIPIEFIFSGNPQLISMYTGEVRKDYAFKDGRVTDNVNVGPDLSIPIQGGTSAVEKKSYAYTYTQAGNYKVYFVAANVSVDHRKEVVRQLDITVTD